MQHDTMRSKLEVKFYCSIHTENELNFSTSSKIGASSAYEINAKILVHPCSRCRQEAEKIENAARVLMSVGKMQPPSEIKN